MGEEHPRHVGRRECDATDIRARLDAGEERMKRIEDRLDKSDRTQSEIKAELSLNTAVTTDLRDIMAAAKAGFKVIGWIGAAAKWLSIVIGAGTTVYVAIQTWDKKPLLPSSASIQAPRNGAADTPQPK